VVVVVIVLEAVVTVVVVVVVVAASSAGNGGTNQRENVDSSCTAGSGSFTMYTGMCIMVYVPVVLAHSQTLQQRA
jgi:hypothetical protein